MIRCDETLEPFHCELPTPRPASPSPRLSTFFTIWIARLPWLTADPLTLEDANPPSAVADLRLGGANPPLSLLGVEVWNLRQVLGFVATDAAFPPVVVFAAGVFLTAHLLFGPMETFTDFPDGVGASLVVVPELMICFGLEVAEAKCI